MQCTFQTLLLICNPYMRTAPRLPRSLQLKHQPKTYRGFQKLGAFFQSPHDKDHSILGFILKPTMHGNPQIELILYLTCIFLNSRSFGSSWIDIGALPGSWYLYHTRLIVTAHLLPTLNPLHREGFPETTKK